LPVALELTRSGARVGSTSVKFLARRDFREDWKNCSAAIRVENDGGSGNDNGSGGAGDGALAGGSKPPPNPLDQLKKLS
jgi:hypothetical protein